ncbi:hypothetical protein [Actinoplanes sp. GCM10030250]|uniref:hypothetical protein n=1 Tax=Actinoplanes sp. GCM10030250 TaxID=3273376 RepID=UPI003613EFBF
MTNWARVSDLLQHTSDLPALVLRGSWANRPPIAIPQQGRFELVHLLSGHWLLNSPLFPGTPSSAGTSSAGTSSAGTSSAGTSSSSGSSSAGSPFARESFVSGEPSFVGAAGDPAWVGQPAGIVAAPTAWFTNPAETEAVPLPGREIIAGRPCSRLRVSYSRHSRHSMTLWLDDEWPLVLAARSGEQDPARFEVRVTELHQPSTSESRRYTALASEAHLSSTR